MSGRRSESTASGVSLPIDPIASSAFAASGREHHLHVLLRVAERQLQLGAAARRAARGSARRAGRRAARARARTSRRTAGGRDLRLRPPRRGRCGPARGRRGRACPAAGGPCAGCGRPGCRARPASDASTTQPSVVSSQRPGRRPLRSSVAPITRPVGERDRGGPVPRLGQALVEAVEAAQLVGDVGAAVVGLGHHHHQRVRQRAPGRARAARARCRSTAVSEPRGPDHGQHLLHVVAEELRGELRLARTDPVDVSAQRVDLAVVRDHPIRVRELPAREGVRREARVNERERARHPLVGQVGEVPPELRRRQHPLVDERPRGEARDHEVGAGRAARPPA